MTYYVSMNTQDLTGNVYGDVTLIEFTGWREFNGGQKAPMWLGQCNCGTERAFDVRALKSGRQKDCGHRRFKSNPANPIFSPEDKDLAKLFWHLHNVGYAQRGGGNSKSFAHRVVLERKIGRPLEDGEITDHINRNKLDNRRENLRVADKSLNTINRDIRPDNSTGYVGVTLYRPKQWEERGWAKRYHASVYRNGKSKSLGYYKTPEEANKAREAYLNAS